MAPSKKDDENDLDGTDDVTKSETSSQDTTTSDEAIDREEDSDVVAPDGENDSDDSKDVTDSDEAPEEPTNPDDETAPEDEPDGIEPGDQAVSEDINDAPKSKAKARSKAKTKEPANSDDEMDLEDDSDVVDPLENMGRDETRHALYGLLFASDRPMSATRLAEAISEHMDAEVVGMMLEELREEINAHEDLPYFLKEIGGGYQLLSKAVCAPFIRRLYKIKKSKRLSKAVLETLAIIAYKQPTTRAEVEAIRGVSVSHAFEQLQEKRFIKVSGVADLPGRPKLYRTTDDFLMQFGLGTLKELPTLEELQEMR